MSDAVVMCSRVVNTQTPVPGSTVGKCNRCSYDIFYSPVTAKNMETMDLELVCDHCLYAQGVPDDVEIKTFEGAWEEIDSVIEELGLDRAKFDLLKQVLGMGQDADVLRFLMKAGIEHDRRKGQP